jgi:hypothetical protein
VHLDIVVAEDFAQTTVSCVKFFGTPPPIISRPVVPASILSMVSSRKSAMASSTI